MSALAWLFGLGALAVVFPFLFHLIRRTPKGQQEFSSLMFLRPSPPRLTRRSRLENLLLLALRMGAVALIALAFMRPFFRSRLDLGLSDTAGRKVAILLDTSASMQRPGLWDQAVDRVTQLCGNASAGDEVAVYTFDSAVRAIQPFDSDSIETSGDANKATKSQIETLLKDLKPGYGRSDLGLALSIVADELDNKADEQDNDIAVSKPQIVVVSDMQAGSSTDALQNFGWPENVRVDIERIESAGDNTNASLELLPSDPSEPDAMREFVMVRNATDSTSEEFTVAWKVENTSNEKRVPFYVPPGSNRILKVARGNTAIESERLTLGGDDTDFDNLFFVVPPNQQQVQIAYLGNEDDADPDQMLYYFQRCLPETPVRKVNLVQHRQPSEPKKPKEKAEDDSANESPSNAAASKGAFEFFEYLAADPPNLVVVTRSVTPDEQSAIDQFLADGGSVFIVLGNEEMIASTQAWTGVEPTAKLTDPGSSDYGMLGEIDFEHPLFRIFAKPRLNDFTQIRFWRHMSVKLSDENTNLESDKSRSAKKRLVASFDDGDPAIWQIDVSDLSVENAKDVERKDTPKTGSVLVLAAGWQPPMSQMALSSKFLPMMNRIVALSIDAPKMEDALYIGETLALPPSHQDAMVSYRGVGGERSFKLDEESKLAEEFSQPGVYRVAVDGPSASSTEPLAIAMNIHPAESNTDVMPLEQLTALGVNAGLHADAATDQESQRKLKDQELEGRQRLWKWLILGALGLIMTETWLAGRTDRNTSPVQE